MRALVVALLFIFTLALGCDSRPRREKSGVSLDDSAPSGSESANVYRFVGVAQSLTDARKAIAEERWGTALVAARALLRQEPGHVEALKIADTATFEAMNQMHFDVFQRSVTAKDYTAAGTHYRQIANESVYYERARPEYEKVRDQWGSARETDTRTLAGKGRCRDAHRVAKVAGDAFPELRARLDGVADNCRPTAGQEAESDGAAAASSSPALASLAPVRPSAPAEPHATPTPAAESAKPASAPAVVAPVPAALPVAPTRPVGPRMIPAFELEKLRIAGEPKPSLTAGTKMISHRDGVKQLTAALAFCVSAEGVPEHVELVKPTDFSDLNQKIIHDVSAWRFRPYPSGDGPIAVCTRVILMWQLE